MEMEQRSPPCFFLGGRATSMEDLLQCHIYIYRKSTTDTLDVAWCQALRQSLQMQVGMQPCLKKFVDSFV